MHTIEAILHVKKVGRCIWVPEMGRSVLDILDAVWTMHANPFNKSVLLTAISECECIQ